MHLQSSCTVRSWMIGRIYCNFWIDRTLPSILFRPIAIGQLPLLRAFPRCRSTSLDSILTVRTSLDSILTVRTSLDSLLTVRTSLDSVLTVRTSSGAPAWTHRDHSGSPPLDLPLGHRPPFPFTRSGPAPAPSPLEDRPILFGWPD